MKIRMYFLIFIISSILGCTKDKSTNSATKQPPSAPSNLIGLVLSSSSIRLSWADNSNNETGFLIFRSNTDAWTQVGTVEENQTSFTDTNLVEVNLYRYYIVATNLAGNSTPSDIVTLSTELAAPTNLTGQVLSASTIQLNWFDNSNVETGFTILRNSAGIWSTIGTVQQNQSTYTDRNLNEATSFQYYVVARDSFGISAPSDTISLITELSPPTNLVGSVISASLVRLQWADHSQHESGFFVYRNSNDAWAQIGSTQANQTTFPDSNVIESETYQYYVIATYGNGNSHPTDTISLDISGIFLIGNWNSNAGGVFVQGDYAYVAGNGLSIINVSNPVAPEYVGGIGSEAEAVYVSGAYAYLAGGNAGLQLINISAPSSPILSGSYDTPGGAEDVFVLGSYAYVADGYSGLQIVNISNPANPTFSGNYDTPGVAHRVFVSGNYAYIADDWAGGLEVINVSDPNNPIYVGVCFQEDYAFSIFVQGIYAFAGYRYSFEVFNISDPSNPGHIGSYHDNSAYLHIFVQGNYAYLAKYSGLQILDISNPSYPANVATWSGHVSRVFAIGNYIYAAGSDGLLILRFVP